jgi:hypothetical protein
VLVGLGWLALAPWIPLSGFLVWVAVACLGANLAPTIGAARAVHYDRDHIPLARDGRCWPQHIRTLKK